MNAALALSGYRSPSGRAVRAVNARTIRASKPMIVEVTALARSGASGRRHKDTFILRAQGSRF